MRYLILLLSFTATAQNATINSGLDKLKASPATSRIERFHESARVFINTPYVGGVLEKSPEQLIIEPDSLDCLTFVEYALALTLAAENDASSCAFPHILQQIRYRNGEINNYASRLHYTLEWSRENQLKGRLSDVTAQCSGAVTTTKDINFMTTHVQSYKELVANPELIDEIKATEEMLSALPFSYIPCSEIDACENTIFSGDIILFTGTIPGLDIVHLGIACIENGALTFIHASSDAMKVIINPEPLSVYCEKMKRVNGIIVLRINEAAAIAGK